MDADRPGHAWTPQCGRYLGPQTDRVPEHALVCRYAGEHRYGPICGAPATVHLRLTGTCDHWHDTTACAEHAPIARLVGFREEHPTTGSACFMPGSVWQPSGGVQQRRRSRCVIDSTGVPVQRVAVATPASKGACP